jgi:hypothetical protein
LAGFMDSWGLGGQGSIGGIGATPPYFPVSDAPAMGNWGLGTPTTVSGLPSTLLPSVIPGASGTSGIGGVAGVGGVAAGALGKQGLGFNMPTANLALTGLNTIGNLWAAFQAQKLAKEQFKYTKNVTDTNLANQIKTYNTGLTDRANNRAIVEGNSADQTKSYIDANQLSRYGS